MQCVDRSALPNLKSLPSPSIKIRKATKNAKIWVVWGVRSHPRSPETSPFDRAHMTSYSTLIETMRLSCTVFELLRVFRRKWPNLAHPTCIIAPVRDDPIQISLCSLASEN